YSSEEIKGGINVQGEKDKTKLSRYKLDQEEIKRLPGAQGDSLKALQTLPGVFPSLPVGLNPTPQFNVNITGQPYRNSDRGDFILRGAGPRANQYYFNGFPVSYPFHLGGLSSVFNNNIIKSLEIYSGAYSARYGYATGGIINIESKNEVRKKSAVWNINTFLTDVYFESPLFEDSYMMAGARKSYPNIFLLRAYPQGIPPDSKYADYGDFQWKAGWKFLKYHKITLVSFGSRDIQNYTRSQAEFESNNGRADNRPPVGLDRSFVTNGIQYDYNPNSRFETLIRVSRNDFKEYFEVRFDNPLTAETIFGLSNVTRQRLIYVENISKLTLWKNHLDLEFGGTYRERKINLNADNISSRSTGFFDLFNDLLNSNPTFRSLVDGDRVLAKETGGFVESKFTYAGFRWDLGARYDYYELSNDKRISPRSTISYEFEKLGTTFSAGSGIYRNSPVGIEQISLKSGNPNLYMESSEHNVFGINQEFWKDWVFKAELFRNIYRDLVTPDSYISNPYAYNNNPRDIVEKTSFVVDNPIYPRQLFYSNSGDGFSEGVEIYLKKSPPVDFLSGWFGWISYSNSRTKRNNHQSTLNSDETRNRTINNGVRKLIGQTKVGTNTINYYDNNELELLYDNDKSYLYDFDRTHVLNVVFGWKFNKNWQLGGRFRYASNVPITPIVDSNKASVNAAGGFTFYFPKYSEYYNSTRLLPIHQLDIRIDNFQNYEWGYMNWYVELINLYGRRNPISQSFDNTRPYSSDNPRNTFDTLNSPYIQTTLPGGRKLYLPMIVIGMEVRF
ncbi:MAG: TonB-dependent receptor plug domain-containing protein, partial [Leptospiraceae bacterium]|nr:TonB-dependent receptor plug domain-containing protein [Leptospiraceae bacterium]